MMASVRRAVRRHAPEPLRLGFALVRRRMRDGLSGRSRLIAGRRGPGPVPSGLHRSVEVVQPIRRSAHWEGKVENIRLAASRMDGVVLQPGEIFSFWTLVGRPTAAAGFRVGRSIRGDAVAADVGGGLCQISGIAYEVGLRAGLTVLERHPHTRDLYTEDTRFTPLGLDATVVWPQKDMRLRNGLDRPVAFAFEVEGLRLTAALLSADGLKPASLDIRRVDGTGARQVEVRRVDPSGMADLISADRYAIETALAVDASATRGWMVRLPSGDRDVET